MWRKNQSLPSAESGLTHCYSYREGGRNWQGKVEGENKKVKKNMIEKALKKWKPKRDISATGKMSPLNIVNIIKTFFSVAHLCLD